MKDRSKKSYVLIIALCWLAYMVAYMGRLNFNAYIEPIRDCLGASKAGLSALFSFSHTAQVSFFTEFFPKNTIRVIR